MVTAFLPPLTLGDGLHLIRGVGYTRINAEGEANSFTARSIELMLIYEMADFELFARVSGGSAKYHVVNPVFDTRRGDDLGMIAAGFNYYF